MSNAISKHMGFENHEADYTLVTDGLTINGQDYTQFKYGDNYYFVFCVTPTEAYCRQADSILKTALDDVDIVKIRHDNLTISKRNLELEIFEPVEEDYGFIVDCTDGALYNVHIHPRTYDLYRLMKFFTERNIKYATGITLYEYYMNNFYCGRYGKPHFSFPSDKLYIYCWNPDLLETILARHPNVHQVNLYPFIEKRSTVLYTSEEGRRV